MDLERHLTSGAPLPSSATPRRDSLSDCDSAGDAASDDARAYASISAGASRRVASFTAARAASLQRVDPLDAPPPGWLAQRGDRGAHGGLLADRAWAQLAAVAAEDARSLRALDALRARAYGAQAAPTSAGGAEQVDGSDRSADESEGSPRSACGGGAARCGGDPEEVEVASGRDSRVRGGGGAAERVHCGFSVEHAGPGASEDEEDEAAYLARYRAERLAELRRGMRGDARPPEAAACAVHPEAEVPELADGDALLAALASPPGCAPGPAGGPLLILLLWESHLPAAAALRAAFARLGALPLRAPGGHHPRLAAMRASAATARLDEIGLPAIVLYARGATGGARVVGTLLRAHEALRREEAAAEAAAAAAAAAGGALEEERRRARRGHHLRSVAALAGQARQGRMCELALARCIERMWREAWG